MSLNELNRSIFEGLRNACQQSMHFNGFLFPDIKPEYLITVNVAQSIYDGNSQLIVKLEDSTENFKNNSVGKGDLMVYFKFIDAFKIERKGRIDIALYDKKGDAICPIELKGFNVSNTEIIKDLARNINFLSYSIGQNQIRYAIVAFLIEDKHCYVKSQVGVGLNKLKNKYQDLVNKHFGNNSDLKIIIHTATVYENLFDTFNEIDAYEEEDIADILSEKAHYIGVIISICKE